MTNSRGRARLAASVPRPAGVDFGATGSVSVRIADTDRRGNPTDQDKDGLTGPTDVVAVPGKPRIGLVECDRRPLRFTVSTGTSTGPTVPPTTPVPTTEPSDGSPTPTDGPVVPDPTVPVVVTPSGSATPTAPASTPATDNDLRTASATFTAANDSVKPVNDTAPRGTTVFSQTGPTGPITGQVSLTGLGASKAYLVVPYTDGGCAPTPGVTAFPSSRFTTDASGAANTSVTVNPAGVNPTGTLDLRNVRSISIREVALAGPSAGPTTLPNAPTPVTEACDTAPVIN